LEKTEIETLIDLLEWERANPEWTSLRKRLKPVQLREL
jgi:hypothetical protein